MTFCPLDLRTIIHWNVNLAIFQYNHICQDCWKNTRSKFKCVVILQSRGQICPVVFHLFWTLSPGFDNKLTLKCWSGIFSTILTYMNMLENCQKQHFSVWLFFNPGDKTLFCLKFNGARISEWNISHISRVFG